MEGSIPVPVHEKKPHKLDVKFTFMDAELQFAPLVKFQEYARLFEQAISQWLPPFVAKISPSKQITHRVVLFVLTFSSLPSIF
jgi:hypothetical protein